MTRRNHEHQRSKFFIGIILPIFLAVIISLGSIYFFILPAFKNSFLESKKEMIQELTSVAWNILAYYENEERSGNLTQHDAQLNAAQEIRHLRYGPANKDYFFITDLNPRMIMHPYSPELEGTDLSSFKDSDGIAIFVEMKNIATSQESGFLGYTWHTKYNNPLAAPKLSFVKQFKPWHWVVGTGVFLDDVENKIAFISRRLKSMALATVAIFTLLLLYATRQSFRIEKKRRDAEEKLRLSREKYKALAESATDPVTMLFDHTIIYANKSMASMLKYPQGEIEGLKPEKLFPEDCDPGESGMDVFAQALEGNITEDKYEGLLSARDGSLVNVEITFSAMRFGSQKAIVMTARDIRTNEEQKQSIDALQERFNNMASKLRFGTFKVAADADLTIEEASDTTLQFFGIENRNSLADEHLLYFICDINERKDIRERIDKGLDILERPVKLKQKNSNLRATYSLSLIAIPGPLDHVRHYDGMLKDISQKKKEEQQRENLIVELQTSLLFLNQPIKFSLKNFVSCGLNTSISQATRIMAKNRQSSILVTSESGEMIGIITDMVLRERVIAENLPYETPVYKVMSSPLIYIDSTALIFEAVLLMQEKNIKHLVVKNSTGEAVSVISNDELLNVHRYSTAFILSQIKEAESFTEILEIPPRVPRIVKSLADSGAHAKNITRVITRISDAILEKIIDLTIEEIGEPPKRFAFISVGSEGRGEQTLVTDQDNALIIENVSPDEEDTVRAYFTEFGRRVCSSLDMAGYQLCKGEIMAMNPKWCQPISIWEEYFTAWVKKGGPQDILEVNIFFDLRCLYGDKSLVSSLRKTINDLVKTRAPFLQHLALTSLSFRAPLDIFGNISAEDSKHGDSFDIKKVISCIVGFARVYAVQIGMSNTNTIKRIEELHQKGKINIATFEEITEAYNHLMNLRFRHQVKMIDKGDPPDNYLKLDELSHMDKIMLKKAFSQVASIQKSLSYDFSGTA